MKGVPVHGRKVELDDLYCPFQPKPFQDSTSSPLFNWNRSTALEAWINLLCYHCSPSEIRFIWRYSRSFSKTGNVGGYKIPMSFVSNKAE